MSRQGGEGDGVAPTGVSPELGPPASPSADMTSARRMERLARARLSQEGRGPSHSRQLGMLPPLEPASEERRPSRLPPMPPRLPPMPPIPSVPSVPQSTPMAPSDPVPPSMPSSPPPARVHTPEDGGGGVLAQLPNAAESEEGSLAERTPVSEFHPSPDQSPSSSPRGPRFQI